VIYFSTQYSAWFEVDAVVPPHSAVIGVSAVVKVPRVGLVRGWVVSVYTQPRMNSPYKTEVENANTDQSGGGGNTTGSSATSARAESEPAAQRSSLNGLVRLWTNKAGTQKVFAELLQIRNDTVLVRDAGGKIYEQSFASLSDADVAFLKAGNLPATHFVSAQR
jgi:hypothetical protein